MAYRNAFGVVAFLFASAFCGSSEFIINPFQFEAASGPFEDFSTYTEVDEKSTITVTASTVSWVTLDLDSTSYVYDDKGVDHFAGDFSHQFEVVVDNVINASSRVYSYVVSNSIGSYDQIAGANESLIGFYSVGTPAFVLETHKGGSSSTFDTSITLTEGVRYFVTIDRDDDAGANNTGLFTATIRTGSHTGSVFDTLTVDNQTANQKDYRYIYGVCSNDIGNTARKQDGETKNLNLNE